jgi:hypothetical protein
MAGVCELTASNDAIVESMAFKCNLQRFAASLSLNLQTPFQPQPIV